MAGGGPWVSRCPVGVPVMMMMMMMGGPWVSRCPVGGPVMMMMMMIMDDDYG